MRDFFLHRVLRRVKTNYILNALLEYLFYLLQTLYFFLTFSIPY